jgi:hypothetical protein
MKLRVWFLLHFYEWIIHRNKAGPFKTTHRNDLNGHRAAFPVGWGSIYGPARLGPSNSWGPWGPAPAKGTCTVKKFTNWTTNKKEPIKLAPYRSKTYLCFVAIKLHN